MAKKRYDSRKPSHDTTIDVDNELEVAELTRFVRHAGFGLPKLDVLFPKNN